MTLKFRYVVFDHSDSVFKCVFDKCITECLRFYCLNGGWEFECVSFMGVPMYFSNAPCDAHWEVKKAHYEAYGTYYTEEYYVDIHSYKELTLEEAYDRAHSSLKYLVVEYYD